MSDALARLPAQEALEARRLSGVAPHALAKLTQLFDRTPGLGQVLVFGSRAQGNFRNESDLDLAVDAPDLDAAGFAQLEAQVRRLRALI